MFHTGQRVVCVDDDWKPGLGYGDEKLPVAGQIYTIRAVINRPMAARLGVYLREIENAERDYRVGHHEFAFAARRFRPAVEKKTDISCFTDMLLPVETPPREKVGG